jgi:NAD(P)-dependent dehydrogenase (short-subunit alcohol dehydrogenase family)
MGNSLSGKVVVVTGGTAGLGRAIVRAMAEEGAAVGIIARDRQRLEATRQEAQSLGGRAAAVSADVADARQVESAADEIEHALGPIDIWVNNAMTSVFAPVKEMMADEFRRVTEVTYLGFVYGTMAALKRMLPRNRGKIIQVGSALAERSIPLQAAYCGAKHAIRGFTDSLRCELIHDGSRIELTMVQMPAMNTPQFGWVRSRLARKAQPVPPIYQPEVGARAVVWAAKHHKRELYVGMPTVEAIVGNKLAPGLLDKYLATSAYDGQQTDQPEDANRPDNLYDPVAGPDIAAHGTFDNRSRSRSPELWLATHKRLALAAAALLAAATGAAIRRRRRPWRLAG